LRFARRLRRERAVDRLAAGLAHGAVTGLWFGVVFGIWLGRPGRARPRALVPRWPRSADLRRVFGNGFTLAIALVMALGCGIVADSVFGPAAGLPFGALVLLAVEFRNLWSIPAADSPTPGPWPGPLPGPFPGPFPGPWPPGQ
jgi:hypothetical protein